METIPARSEIIDKKKIVGEVILGDTDPRTLSREDFNKASGALFHGHKGSGFNYYLSFDYASDEYLNTTDGSATLGQGLYLTDSLKEAENYSKMRTSGSFVEQGSEVPTSVEVFVPFKARMLDLRLRENQNENGHFPKKLAESWSDYYDSFYNRLISIIESSNSENGKNIIPEAVFSTYSFYQRAGIFEKYKDLIKEVIESDNLDLRYLLGTAENEDFRNNLGNALHSPPWVPLFTSFIKEAGFDGLIYNESGDASHFGRAPSYVFYNLNKVGNYESWHSGEHTVEEA
jgi:hypothetical protein